MAHLKITHISDTVCRHDNLDLPGGDVLIHSGNMCVLGYGVEMIKFLEWWNEQPYTHKIIVPGCQDKCLDSSYDNVFKYGDVGGLKWRVAILREYTGTSGHHFLYDGYVTIEGVNFYGTPWSEGVGNKAFLKPAGVELSAHWDMIRENTDILITHCPPYGIMDFNPLTQTHIGSEGLLKRVKELKLDMHLFGKAQGDYGMLVGDNTVFINSALYEKPNVPLRKPATFLYNKEEKTIEYL